MIRAAMRVLAPLLLAPALFASLDLPVQRISSRVTVQTLQSTGGLAPHLAGKFEEITACEQTPEAEYLIFDRRSHAVVSVSPARDTAVPVLQIGVEAGRILIPTAFDVADDGTFVVADAPGGRGRIQVFFAGGTRLAGFTLPHREDPLVVLEGMVLSGVSSIEYTGRSILMSQPESGALVVEYALDGRTVRTFGALRQTGHEGDTHVHRAMNSGLVVINPRGGFYYVFLAGVPLFRKYDAAGALVFERHVEGVELDEYVRTMPTTWRRRRSASGVELPLVQPAIRAAAADGDGNLWISLRVPFTYVYDVFGDKRRVVQFRAAGIVQPVSMTFASKGQLLVAPGCFRFDPR